MPSQRLIFRHALVSVTFVLLYLLLNRPEVIFISRIGFVALYPAIGLVMALLLGISPWYGLLVCFADALAGKVIYAQPVMSFSGAVGSAGSAFCYAAAAYLLRGSLRIDLGLRRRRDVVRYVFVSTTAAAAASIICVACLTLDHSVAWGEFRSSAVSWFLGDAIGLVGISPFLLVHIFPHLRSWLSPAASQRRPPGGRFTLPKLTFAGIVEPSGQALTILAVLLVIFGPRD